MNATEQPAARQRVNVAARLAESARANPNGLAVAAAKRRGKGRENYDTLTFGELDALSNRLAQGLIDRGARRGMRLVLMVPPGVEFIALVFALFKAGVVVVLVDPGMGGRRMIRCLEEIEPEGFIGVPLVQAARLLWRRKFPRARLNVTVGRRWFWGGATYEQLADTPAEQFQPADTTADEPAAIIFTTGSTGPPKGVLYRHGNFAAQVDHIRDFYDIKPGEIDVAAFPLFALFSGAMGVATVVPRMNAARPAAVDPRNIIAAVNDWGATQSFASPAVWNVVGRYCREHDIHLPTLKRVLTAGAPAPVDVLKMMMQTIAESGDMHTPYGATEALPVASIAASEVLAETAEATRRGAGTCVGRRFSGIEWKVAKIVDGPIASIDEVEELPLGEIGELLVRGAVVTTEYVAKPEANALQKVGGRVGDGDGFWHRMGDVGYLDEHDRFWFCGRKAHRVQTSGGVMFTIPCEAIINEHKKIYRSALVGIGEPPRQRAVIVAEPLDWGSLSGFGERKRLIAELTELAAGNQLTAPVKQVLLRQALPVDIRHNAKIFREKLAVWAAPRCQ